MDDKSPLKGAWFCSRDPFLYAQLWSYNPLSSPLAEVLLANAHTTDFADRTYGA